jgi:Asp-tRNA(Asn)/Glu-tRNA(Gln) amidotransferase B subunit
VRDAHLGDLARLLVHVVAFVLHHVAELEPHLATGREPLQIVQARGLEQVADRGALGAHIDAVLASLPAKVEEYRAGKKGLLGFFQGQVVRASGGSADPKVVKEMLEERLGR